MKEKLNTYLKRLKLLIPMGLIVLVALIVIFSSFYTVDPEEAGVVKRFGKYNRTTKPGLHFKLPWGIEDVIKVKIERIYKEEFGFRTKKAGVRTEYQPDSKEIENESLMLTGDLNCVVVEWIVQYKIKSPVNYLFNIRNARKTLRDISEATMRLIVGDRSVDEVITTGRTEIEAEVQQLLQQSLDEYDIGLNIVTVKLQDVNPPEPVKPSFNEVNEARQDKERLINEAKKEYNTIIPKAKGQKEAMISEAKGYAIERVNMAQGEANRFLNVWREYKKAPDVTRRRIYVEKLRNIIRNAGRIYIIDHRAKSIIPLLQMDGKEVMKLEK